MTRLLRLVLALGTAAGILALALVALAYSGSRLVHDAASAVELPLPCKGASAEIPSVVYAADGSVIATLRSSLNRQPVPLSQISPVLISAVLDTEDHDFWVHGGVDVKSLARAFLADANAGSAVQGGSTIAQQLVKQTYLSSEKTLTRKLREAVLAQRLEQRCTKAEILDDYLNTVYLGNGAYGVQAAAKEYFNEHASHVDVAQASLLAGLIQAPSGYNPITNPVGARERRSFVLSRMVYYKTISPQQAAAANATPLPTTVHEAPKVSYASYGYYLNHVLNQLLGPNSPLGATYAVREQALFGGGLKIYTNEVPSLQQYAQHVAVADIPSDLQKVQAAFAVMDPATGGVEALVGGNGQSQFDVATQGERQPGSGFKLFTLIGALEEGYNVEDSVLAASPCAVIFPNDPYGYGYDLQHPLHNDPGQPGGAVTLVQATALSINCAYLRLAHEVGLPKVIQVAKSLGLSDPTLSPLEPSLVIGTEAVKPIEMAAAYATVADGGIYHAPSFINKIKDASGAVIYNADLTGTRVFSEQVAAEALVALRATVQYGTGTAAALPNQDVAGKTGTTDHSVDAWFNGVTPALAASVWIGDPAGEVPMYANGVEVYGASYPTQIWHDVMDFALRTTPFTPFPTPDPALMPPIKYVDSPGLRHDDLISHGGVGPASCVASGANHPCPVKTTTTSTTAAPATTAPPPASTAPATTSPPPASTAPGTTGPPQTLPVTTPRVTAAPTIRTATSRSTTTVLATTVPPTTTLPPTTVPTTTLPTTTLPTTTLPTTTLPTTTLPTTTVPTTTVPTTAAGVTTSTALPSTTTLGTPGSGGSGP
jgi:membrane peptidoglycan carboxypeptidase